MASEPRHRSRLGRPFEGVTEDWLCLPNSPATEENRATGHAYHSSKYNMKLAKNNNNKKQSNRDILNFPKKVAG